MSVCTAECDFKAFTEFSTNIFWRIDEEGVIRYISPSVEKLLGYKVEDFIGRKIPPHIPTSYHDAYLQTLHYFLQIERRTFEHHRRKVRHRNGHIVTLSTRAKPLFDGNAFKGYIGESRWISESGNALYEYDDINDHLFLKTIVETLPIRLFWTDRDLRFIGANRLFLKDISPTHEPDLFGHYLQDCTPPETSEILCRGDHLILHGYRDFFIDEALLPLPHKEQLYVSIYKTALKDSHGNVTGVLSAYIDISSEKEKERHLQRSLERLRQAQEQAFMGYWDYDPRSGALHWSEGMYTLLGYDTKRPSIKLADLRSHFDRENFNALFFKFIKALKNPNYTFDEILEIRRLDGKKAFIHTKAIVSFSKGSAEWVQGIAVDVSTLKSLEDNNRKKLTMLMERDKLAQIGELLNDITHQWKQPLAKLNALLLDFENAWAEGAVDEKLFRKFFEQIEDVTVFMGETIDHFTSYLKPNGPLQPVGVLEALEQAQRLMDVKFSKTPVDIQCLFDQSLKVLASKQDLTHIFMILLSNALDVFESRRIPSPTITIRARALEDHVVLSVEDNGGGIDPSIQKRIFEPYISTKSSSSNRGLGLFIARSIVEKKLKGSLTLEQRDPPIFTLHLRNPHA